MKPELWRPSEIGPFGQGELVFGAALMAIGGWLLKVRNDILRLLPTDALCARMELSEATLKPGKTSFSRKFHGCYDISVTVSPYTVPDRNIKMPVPGDPDNRR